MSGVGAREPGAPAPDRRTRGRLGALLVDVRPLRDDRGFRMLWAGEGLAFLGSQVARLALPFQVYLLTGSTLAIGLLALVQVLPIAPFSLLGGALADARDRRRILFVAAWGQLLVGLALAALALMPDPSLLVILAVAFAGTGLSAVEQPARSAMIPHLVPSERLPAAIAINQLGYQVASIVGPAAGGLVMASIGIPAAYLVHAAMAGVSLLFLLGVPSVRPDGVPPGSALAGVREGLRFVFRKRIILSTFAIDLVAMVFGMPTALFPVLALDVFGTGPVGVGVMAAAPGVGAFVGALLSGWVGGVRRQGLAVILAVLVWGFAIVGFGLATFSFALALAMLALAGAADVISAVFRGTIVQMTSPDDIRGRVMAVHGLVVTSGPRLGDLEAALVASMIGAQGSVVLGGLMCIGGVFVVMRWFPELRHYRPVTPAEPPRSQGSARAEATTF